jgi:hypothetical protein
MCVAGLAAALVLAGAARPAAAQEQDKECLDLIRKAVKAHGGEKVLEATKALTVKSKGVVHVMGGLKITNEDQVQFPDKFRSDLHIDVNGMDIAIVQAFDGKKGWIQAGGKTMDLDDKQTAEFKALLYGGKVANLIDLLKDKKYEISPVGEAQVNDQPAVGVLVKRKDHRDVSLFFDKKTGRLAKQVMTVVDQMSQMEVMQEKIFTEYKAIDGRQVPHKVTVNQDGKVFVEVEVTDVTVVERHDPSVFAKPE